jgi:hypothetical protein
MMGEGAAWGFHIHWTLFALTGLVMWGFLSSRTITHGWIYLAIWFGAFLINDNRALVPTLFPEIWATFFLVLAFSFLASVAKGTDQDKTALIVAGVLLGLSVWTRNNLLAVLPFWGLIIVWHTARITNLRKGLIYGSLFLLAVLLLVCVVTARNRILAPEAPLSLLMTPERSERDLFQGFQLKEITKEDIAKSPFLSKLRYPTARFIEGIRRHPGLFIHYQIDRVLILFGLPAFWEEKLVRDYPKFNLWHLFLWILIIRRMLILRPKRAFGYASLLCWGIVLSQILMLPFTGYLPAGYRLLLPIYPFLLLLGLLPAEEAYRKATLQPTAGFNQ